MELETIYFRKVIIKMRIKEIKIEDELYPEQLRYIKNPPNKLYVLGNEKILNNKSLSIVGSRNASEYGKIMARKFASQVAMQDINIVSGMAKGIDSEAHLGALEVKGKTVAVLGSGFNHIFPDRYVFDKILEKEGAIVTEYEPNIEVFPDGFRQRNRIVAGLSLGTLVIEAKEKSGTGITAEFVNKFNRKLFCIPHEIGDEHGTGTNRLLKNGAILVTEIMDIVRHFQISEIVETVENLRIEIPEEYKEIFEKIPNQPISSDQISKLTGKSISEVNTILTMLELEGFIKSMPGNCFKRQS